MLYALFSPNIFQEACVGAHVHVCVCRGGGGGGGLTLFVICLCSEVILPVQKRE